MDLVDLHLCPDNASTLDLTIQTDHHSYHSTKDKETTENNQIKLQFIRSLHFIDVDLVCVEQCVFFSRRTTLPDPTHHAISQHTDYINQQSIHHCQV